LLSWSINAKAATDLYPSQAKNGLYGYLNSKKAWVISPQFQAANHFMADDSAWVKKGGLYLLIDRQGQVIFRPDPQPNSFEPPVSNSLLLANVSGDKRGYGFLDSCGRWAIEPEFQRLEPFDSVGMSRAIDQATALCGFIGLDGNWVIKPNFQDLFHFTKNGWAAAEGHDGLEGYIDRNSQGVIKPKYVMARPFNDQGWPKPPR
jgi:hypothetical protein